MGVEVKVDYYPPDTMITDFPTNILQRTNFLEISKIIMNERDDWC